MNKNLQKGILTEQRCILKCLECGFNVSTPLLDERYDFLLDVNGKICKVQVKTSRWTNENEEAFCFNCKSTHAISKGNKILPYTKDEIDFFMTEKNGNFYLVPVEGNTSQKTLRLVPPKTGQKTGFSLAKDYLFEEVIKTIG